jgi:hypothetical protein
VFYAHLIAASGMTYEEEKLKNNLEELEVDRRIILK